MFRLSKINVTFGRIKPNPPALRRLSMKHCVPITILGQCTPYRLHFTRPLSECQGQMHKFVHNFSLFSVTGTKSVPFLPLTSRYLRAKMNCTVAFAVFRCQLEYAGMVELVDSLDLGAVTSVKVWGGICNEVERNDNCSENYVRRRLDLRNCVYYFDCNRFVRLPANSQSSYIPSVFCLLVQHGYYPEQQKVGQVVLWLSSRICFSCSAVHFFLNRDRFTCFYKSWIRRNAPPRVPPRVKIEEYADVVELVDSLDLGSNARACRFESCHPHQ